ncbi:unnamed protein product [Ranitomeya imitator]|uniref:Importin N-terminal domain-containing protein n=1 Tax=Ranitomeya imitator TaxID=111125 RepID=A0ABN9M5Z7_9NEOB|nr:unnamed protein product [Ranitomeya imitator]
MKTEELTRQVQDKVVKKSKAGMRKSIHIHLVLIAMGFPTFGHKKVGANVSVLLVVASATSCYKADASRVSQTLSTRATSQILYKMKPGEPQLLGSGHPNCTSAPSPIFIAGAYKGDFGARNLCKLDFPSKVLRASEEASLRALESLMSEFFHTSTSNDRKREIEALLNNFAQQLGAWRFCFYFLSSSHNDYVLMYSLSVFENLINKMWLGVPSEEKMEIRGSLPKLLLSQHKALPGFICNKLCKVIVDMGRQDWPMFYHDFFTNILQLIQTPSTTPLGLIMLKTASEELACPREDLSVARKEELRKLLLEQVPTVLGLLTGVLESIWDKHSVTAATPPPSPTASDADDLLSNLVHTPALSKQLSQPPPSLEAESERICALALECLSHLFSWIPLSASITPSLLTTIFHFARLGCDARSRRTHAVNNTNAVTLNGGGSSSPPLPLTLPTSQQDCNKLGVLAMSCINELMCKNCVPLEFQEYLLRVCQQTFYLLQRITRETNAHSVRSRLEELDESYVEKFTDFLRLFVSVHLRRIESNAQFPVVEFLALLFKYTFHQPTHEGYLSCLDIWALFLDYLTNKIRNRLEDRDTIMGRYEDALVLLLTEVLNRIQFRYNQTQLEELDDDTLMMTSRRSGNGIYVTA